MKGVCYGVQQDAIDAFFQSIPPATFYDAGNTVIQSYQKGETGWSLIRETISSTGSGALNYSLPASDPLMGTCDHPYDPESNFLDGMELGWGVAGVMVIVYVIRRVHR